MGLAHVPSLGCRRLPSNAVRRLLQMGHRKRRRWRSLPWSTGWEHWERDPCHGEAIWHKTQADETYCTPEIPGLINIVHHFSYSTCHKLWHTPFLKQAHVYTISEFQLVQRVSRTGWGPGCTSPMFFAANFSKSPCIGGKILTGNHRFFLWNMGLSCKFSLQPIQKVLLHWCLLRFFQGQVLFVLSLVAQIWGVRHGGSPRHYFNTKSWSSMTWMMTGVPPMTEEISILYPREFKSDLQNSTPPIFVSSHFAYDFSLVSDSNLHISCLFHLTPNLHNRMPVLWWVNP